MGAIPCTDSITIEFGCQFRVELTDNCFQATLKAFSMLLQEPPNVIKLRLTHYSNGFSA